MTLTKWNPTKELLSIDREFRKVLDSFNSFGTRKTSNDDGYESAVWSPLTDIVEDKDNYLLKLDLPGVDKKDVKLNFTNGELQISGERKEEKENKDATFHRIERAYGKYYRSFKLPEKIKEEKISAKFDNGSLTVTIPKADEIKPKEIEISVS